MLVKTYGGAIQGIDAIIITIEVNIGKGRKFYLVGLPDNAIKESQQRMVAALNNMEYRFPGQRIVINMAPADIKKEGSAYDLPIALGILSASQQITADKIGSYVIMGELSLDGSINPIKGALPIAIKARDDGFTGVILPEASAREAAIVDGIEVHGFSHMSEVIDFLEGKSHPEAFHTNLEHLINEEMDQYPFDFNEVKGQENIKRALEVAAAGGHNMIMIGSPGSGKTMLAKRLPSILPPMTMREAIETSKIHSVIGVIRHEPGLVSQRPFRAPHHTISDAGLVGGGTVPQPGEISLAHNGVLFLDELPEFKRSVLEVMRQPMEDRIVTISRARVTITYPSGFMLIAAMNPCPCGHYNDPARACVCTPGNVKAYLNRISGPLMDRIDLHVEVIPVEFANLRQMTQGESSEVIRKRVIAARKIQSQRFENLKIHCNAQMARRDLEVFCRLDAESENLLKHAMERMNLSARAYDRILKVSRTIADLQGTQHISAEHLAEAIQYRSLDRANWGQ